MLRINLFAKRMNGSILLTHIINNAPEFPLEAIKSFDVCELETRAYTAEDFVHYRAADKLLFRFIEWIEDKFSPKKKPPCNQPEHTNWTQLAQAATQYQHIALDFINDAPHQGISNDDTLIERSRSLLSLASLICCCNEFQNDPKDIFWTSLDIGKL